MVGEQRLEWDEGTMEKSGVRDSGRGNSGAAAKALSGGDRFAEEMLRRPAQLQRTEPGEESRDEIREEGRGGKHDGCLAVEGL